ncbi:MAG: hypothetical protein HDR88_06710 [Bacteroides sp.]|nr:hypothetical protein [Bacteroides sp.]
MFVIKSKRLLAGVMAIAAVTSCYADIPESFNKFRQEIFDNFNGFRERILEHYADFLAGEWHEYESLEATRKYSSPKPEEMPAMILTSEEAEGQNKEIFAFGVTDTPEGKRLEIKDPEAFKWIRSAVDLYKSRYPDSLTEEGGGVADIVSPEGIVNKYDGEIFYFYGMKFALPRFDFTLRPEVKNTLDFSYQWIDLEKDSVADLVNPSLLQLQKTSGISDYLVYEMVMAWLDSKFPEVNDASKMSGAHYLLANMGFGVRIGIDGDSNPYMLIPFDEPVYGRSRVQLSGAKDYYVFSTPGKEQIHSLSFSSPVLPDDANIGKPMNLRMSGLNLPMKPYHYEYEHGGLRLEGELNENVMPMLYRYPQMDTGGFGACVISPEVREDVVRQVKEQLADMKPIKAVNKLLTMVQFAFPYATDDNFHGFEKPYFFEESLYYPKNDCEDRAVFYSYLLWHALGLETDLIAYPNHEATAVVVDDVWNGTYYIDREQKYYISDPTYQGAPTGQCMLRYMDVNPIIDLRYTK